MRSLLLTLALTVLAVAPALADTIDDEPEVVAAYARGKRLMREGDYPGASRIFGELVERQTVSSNLDLFLFNRGKAEYYSGDFPKANATFRDYIDRFTESSHLAHAQFFLGNVQYLQGSLDRAVASWVSAYAGSMDASLSNLLVESLAAALAGAKSVSLSDHDFVEIPAPQRCEFINRLSQALVVRETWVVARDLSVICGGSVALPEGVTAEPVNALGGDFEIAVVLPLSGELQEFGQEIHNGAIIAAELFRAETGRSLKLMPYDTEGDPVNTARIVRELVHSTTDAVVGPLTSEEALVASAILSCDRLPLIAPAATQAGLTELSESSFQLSPNVEFQGVRAAEYAVFSLRADSAAVITPTGGDDLRRSRAFARRFRELGGQIVAIQYCRSRDRDFGEYIRDIKAILIGAQPDSTFFLSDGGDTLDIEAVPAHLDCLYLPGDPAQLRLLLPQINFYNLEAVYLGSDGWGDETLYKLGDNITKGAVFTSPFLQQRQSAEYLRFAARYDQRYGGQPQRLASLGYDAVTVVTRALLAGAHTRDELIRELGKIAKYPGAAAMLTFGEHRENIELPMYRLQGGAAIELSDREETAGGSVVE